MGMGQGMSSGGMSGGGMSSGGMSSGGGSPDGEGGYSGASAAVSEDSASEIAIEIFGLVYLYNPENIVTITNELTAEKTESVPAVAGATPVAADQKPETPAADPVPSAEPAATTEPVAVPKSDQPTAPATPEPATPEPATPEPAAAAPSNPSDN
jgi:hypothetical protein